MRLNTARNYVLCVLAASAIVCSASFSRAAVILPGGVQFPALAELNPAGANLVFSTGFINFSSATLDGTLRSNVFNGDTSNPYGLNALTFTYELSASSLSDHDIARLAIPGFGGFLTDASFMPGSGVAPTVINRSADSEVMGFNFFTPAINAGQAASLLVVQTNAVRFQATTASVIDGTTASALSLAPRIVPEPSMMVSVAIALGLGLCGMRKAGCK